MPTYSYYCETCKTVTDNTRSINDPEPEMTCENCGGQVKRLFFSAPVIFKSGGFYSTENKK